ncbi:S-adenosyl-L-methionine-dependent methyltransferase [Whalleya microplaca]|nr:S-adenosyl-L-methionine-dependent methyltransferase [Whalleya microplaca]
MNSAAVQPGWDDPDDSWDPDEATLRSGSVSGSGSEIAAAGPEDIQADEFETSDFDAESISQFGSVASTIYRHAYENGRRNREDIKHVAFLELTRGKYFFSPIGDYPQKIIDLGTGTGAWAIEVAEMFPSAEVVGCDLSPIQPLWVPSNVTFIIDDIADEWAHGDDWDLVHIRQRYCSAPLVQRGTLAVQTNYQVSEPSRIPHIRPGGWIEIQEYGGIIKCDDGTMPADSLVVRFFELIGEALAKRGAQWTVANDIQEHLLQAGFVNIQCKKFKCPIGTWPKAKRLRLIGLYMKPVISELFDGLAPRMFQALEKSPKQMEDFLTGAQNELHTTNAHMYVDYFMWYAQKAPVG